MEQQVQYVLIILLMEADVVQAFGKALDISHITSSPQGHHCMYLIINLF